MVNKWFRSAPACTQIHMNTFDNCQMEFIICSVCLSLCMLRTLIRGCMWCACEQQQQQQQPYQHLLLFLRILCTHQTFIAYKRCHSAGETSRGRRKEFILIFQCLWNFNFELFAKSASIAVNCELN